MVCCTAKCQKWTTFTLSGVLTILGILIVIFWDRLLNKIMVHELSLANSHTKGYSMFKETPIPMYLEFYFFNWTNPDQVHNASAKPHFEEHGPYTFYEHHLRENISYNDNNTITFLTKRLWKFLPEKSVGSLDDKITNLNPIIATVGHMVRFKHYLVRRGVNFFLEEKKETLTITKTVRELTFDGYDDPMLDLVHKLNISGVNVPYTKFGWFVERNGSITYDGIYNMYTGADDINKLGLLSSWNYQTEIPYLKGSCAKVDGTTGELWYPTKGKNTVKLFASDLCSSVELTKNGVYVLYGVEGDRYIGTEKLFDNGTLHPDMKCFVPDGVQQPSGVRNMSLCKFGAPAYVSFAHFYLADPSYREAIDGMRPDPKKHQMYISLEPNTGMPLRVEAMFQLNLQLELIEGINLLSNITPTVMPAFWFKQSATMSKKLTEDVKLLLVLPAAVTNTGYGVIGIGVLLLVIGLFITYKKAWRGSEGEQLLNQQSL